jgi:hypothetical protein
MLNLVGIIAIIASMVLPVVAVVGIVTYVRRTRQLQEAMGDGSPHATVLDSLDQVHVRLDAMSDRLTQVEETLRLGYVAPRPVQEAEKTRRVSPGETSE